MPSLRRPSPIAPLTSLRFGAAMMVVCHHLFGFADGFSGVTFFYVLSGFVLAINYRDRVGTPASCRDFWWKRVARIYPTYLLTFALALPLAISQILAMHTLNGVIGTVAAIPASLLMVQAWFPKSVIFFGVNSVAWSISDEAFFYAVFPALVRWLSSSKRWAVILIWLAATVAIASAWPDRAAIANETSHWLFYVFPITRLIEFAIGVAMGLEFSCGEPRVLGIRSELAAIGGVFATFALLSAARVPWAFRFSLWFLPSALSVIYVFSRSRGPVAVALSHRWLVVLGDASFMLYMIHQLIMRYADLAFGGHMVVRLSAAALSVTLSIGLQFFFERPAQRSVLRLGHGVSIATRRFMGLSSVGDDGPAR